MNKIVAVLFVAGLIIGVITGYGVGFVVYQPQISQLQSDLSETQSALSELQGNFTEAQSHTYELESDLSETQSALSELQGNFTEAQSYTYEYIYHFTPMQVIPEHMEDAVAGQRCVFLVDVEEPEWAKGPAVSISAVPLTIPFDASVMVNPQAITPRQVAEVTVIPGEASANSTLKLLVIGERGRVKKTKTITIEVGKGLAGPLEDSMGPLATEIRDKFTLWLAANHPEFGITRETEWTGAIVRPNILVVMYYLFFSEDWEMGVSWHVTIPPHNWARIYLRRRFNDVRPLYAFEISSWSTEDYEIYAINPPESVWR